MAIMAMVAIWLTPSLEKKQIFPMEPVVVTQPGLEPADFLLQPLVVEATNTELVALSRRNSNVRSLALSMGRKRPPGSTQPSRCSRMNTTMTTSTTRTRP